MLFGCRSIISERLALLLSPLISRATSSSRSTRVSILDLKRGYRLASGFLWRPHRFIAVHVIHDSKSRSATPERSSLSLRSLRVPSDQRLRPIINDRVSVAIRHRSAREGHGWSQSMSTHKPDRDRRHSEIISLRLSPEQLELIDQLADSEEESRSEVVRRAIQHYQIIKGGSNA